MPIYTVVDNGVVSNAIVADQAFVDLILPSHQVIQPYLGSVDIVDKYANDIFVGKPQPSLSHVVVGAHLILTSVANCVLSLSYQWKKDGVDIPSATTYQLEFVSVGSGDTGSYTCVVSDGTNTLESGATLVTVS